MSRGAASNRPGGRRFASIPRTGVMVSAELPAKAVAATRPITVPHVFVLSRASAEQLATLRALEVMHASPYLTRGTSIWCLQTFLELKRRGLPVALSNEPREGCVNFMHARQLYRRRPAPGVFIVSIQADYPGVPWTNTLPILCRTGSSRMGAVLIGYPIGRSRG